MADEKLHVLCARPGMHRGGRSNPEHATYALGEHTPAQLLDLVGDPHIRAVIGGELLTPEMVAAMIEAEGAKKSKAKGA